MITYNSHWLGAQFTAHLLDMRTIMIVKDYLNVLLKTGSC